MSDKLDWSLIASKKEIEYFYHILKYPVSAVAKHLGVGDSTLRNRMQELKIPIRKVGYKRTGFLQRTIPFPRKPPPPKPSLPWEKITSKEELTQLYEVEFLSTRDIAKRLNVSDNALRKHMKKIGIQLRKIGFKRVNETSLHKRLLTSPNFSKRRWKDLAQEFNCSISTVNRAKSSFLKEQRELNKIKENQIPD